MMNRQDLLGMAKAGAKRIEQDFTDPSDDWSSALLVVPAGGTAVFPQIIQFASEEEKGRVLTEIPKILAEQQAALAGLVLSSWMTTFTEKSEPVRQESLVVTACDLRGVEMIVASIIRSDSRPPVLGDWSEGLGKISSQWTEALQSGLSLSRARQS